MWRPIDRSDRPFRVVLWGVFNTPLQGDNKKRRTNNKKARCAQEESSYAPGIFYVPSGAIRSLVIGCWRSK